MMFMIQIGARCKAEQKTWSIAQRKEQMARQAAQLKAQREAEAKRRGQAAEAQRWIALAAQHRAERERLVPVAPGVWTRVGEYPANGGGQAAAQITLPQQNNAPVCTLDNPRGNPFYDPAAVDNLERHKVTTIEIPRYVPGEPAIDPPGHDKVVQGNGWIALAELIGVFNDIVGPHAPPATSDIHAYLYSSVYENGDVRYPGIVITNTSEAPLYLDRFVFTINRSTNDLAFPVPDIIRLRDGNTVILPGATETIEIPVEILPLNQPLIATSIHLRMYLDVGRRSIQIDFP